jgi:hypothetical protein
MKLFSFQRKFAELKSRFTQVGEHEPLSGLAFVAILFLDLFILITIFVGLENHTTQLTTVEDYIPYSCRDMVVGADQKTDNQKIDVLRSYVTFKTPFQPVEYNYNTVVISEIHPICQFIGERLKETNASSTGLSLLYQNLDSLTRASDDVQMSLDRLRNNYDTAVLEKIANMDSEALKMQQERSVLVQNLNEMNVKIAAQKKLILAEPTFVGIWNYVLGNNAEKQKQLEFDFAVAEFWYPVKQLGFDLLYLLPLFILFWMWNSRSIRRELGIQALISSHLLVISFIPIFWKVIIALFDIIPKRFLDQIMRFLTSFKLLGLWYYFLVALGILVGLLVIFLIQKKLFSRERLTEKRISRSDCITCGKHLPL